MKLADETFANTIPQRKFFSFTLDPTHVSE